MSNIYERWQELEEYDMVQRDDKKQTTGLFGEMHLAMKLHVRGWQVHRAYIDSNTDFVITKYWCSNCEDYKPLERRKKSKGKEAYFPTDRCADCLQTSLHLVVRFVQVKTSEGKPSTKQTNAREYSFRAKLRSNVDPRAFYVWIALTPSLIKDADPIPHFYVFHHTEISRFDDLDLPSYQDTDNQKTTLRIDGQGNILNRSRLYDRSCFKEFYNNFEVLDQTIDMGERYG